MDHPRYAVSPWNEWKDTSWDETTKPLSGEGATESVTSCLTIHHCNVSSLAAFRKSFSAALSVAYAASSHLQNMTREPGRRNWCETLAELLLPAQQLAVSETACSAYLHRFVHLAGKFSGNAWQQPLTQPSGTPVRSSGSANLH